MYYQENLDRKKLLIIFISQIVLIPIIIFLISLAFSNPKTTTSISIKNFSSFLPNIPENDKQNIFNQLYEIVTINTDSSQNIQNSNAEIREDTLDIFEDTNFTYGNFIVDIPNLNQSYKIHFEYGDQNYLSGYPILISCIDTTNCKNLLADQTPTLEYLLPYSDFINDTFFSVVKDEFFSPENQQVKIIASICDDKQTQNLIEDNVKKWIKDNNLPIKSITTDYSCFIQK